MWLYCGNYDCPSRRTEPPYLAGAPTLFLVLERELPDGETFYCGDCRGRM